MIRKDKKAGFTMVEIIAVLVIIGIMAAVAAPKFINMAAEARNKAALSGVSECMATLSTAYAREYLDKGSAPTTTEVLADAGLSEGNVTFGDVVVSLTDQTTGIDITTVSVSGTAVDTAETRTWPLPTDIANNN